MIPRLAPKFAYDRALGRFLQTDPIGHAGGLNLYAYVGNDPMNASDPSGLIMWPTSPRGGCDVPRASCRPNSPFDQRWQSGRHPDDTSSERAENNRRAAMQRAGMTEIRPARSRENTPVSDEILDEASQQTRRNLDPTRIVVTQIAGHGTLALAELATGGLSTPAAIGIDMGAQEITGRTYDHIVEEGPEIRDRNQQALERAPATIRDLYTNPGRSSGFGRQPNKGSYLTPKSSPS